MDGEPMAVVYPDNLAALGVCRALGTQGISVSVLSSGRTTPGQYSRFARRVLCPPRTQEKELVEFLIEFGRRQAQPAVLFLTDDASIVTLHRHEEKLKRWYRFPMAPWPVVRRILFKDQLYASLADVVPVPHTRLPVDESQLPQVIQDIGYPVLVKPLLRSFSEASNQTHSFDKLFGSKAVRVRTLRELQEIYRTARALGFKVLVQEEIKGPISALYSVGLYVTREGNTAAAFTAQKLCEVPAEFGDGLVVKATRMPELITLAERAVQHFGYYGMAEIEFKLDPRAGIYKLLDINPRPWHWINLATECGVNLSHVAYLDMLNRPIDRESFLQNDFQTRWVSVRGLIVQMVRSVLSGRLHGDLFGLLGHLRGRRVGPLFNNKDLLLRMFLSPAYWWGSLRQAVAAIRRLHGSRR